MWSPPDWFIEPLHKLQESIYENTAMTGPEPFAVAISAELGLRIGLPPDINVHVRGPCGIIHITVGKEA